MKKSCELCENMAVIFCDSDQASLCWSCDAKVHSANFLVARHSRVLLCHVCQSLTQWSATGSKLGPTLTVCERCIPGAVEEEEEEEESEGLTVADEEDVDVEDEENQVVPWLTTTTVSPPPPPPPSSSDDESFDGQSDVRKRSRKDDLHHSSNSDSEDMTSQNIRTTPPRVAADKTQASGRDETALDSSSATSTLKRRRHSKARRIISGRIDRIEETSE